MQTNSRTASPSPRRRSRTDAARLPLRWASKSRTKEGELYRRIVRQLRRQVGETSAAQELLIARIAWLQVHLAHIDERALRNGGLSEHATREYLSWCGHLTRMLRAFGLKGAEAQRKTLAEMLAEEETEDEAAE